MLVAFSGLLIFACSSGDEEPTVTWDAGPRWPAAAHPGAGDVGHLVVHVPVHHARQWLELLGPAALHEQLRHRRAERDPVPDEQEPHPP